MCLALPAIGNHPAIVRNCMASGSEFDDPLERELFDGSVPPSPTLVKQEQAKPGEKVSFERAVHPTPFVAMNEQGPSDAENRETVDVTVSQSVGGSSYFHQTYRSETRHRDGNLIHAERHRVTEVDGQRTVSNEEYTREDDTGKDKAQENNSASPDQPSESGNEGPSFPEHVKFIGQNFTGAVYGEEDYDRWIITMYWDDHEEPSTEEVESLIEKSADLREDPCLKENPLHLSLILGNSGLIFSSERLSVSERKDPKNKLRKSDRLKLDFCHRHVDRTWCPKDKEDGPLAPSLRVIAPLIDELTITYEERYPLVRQFLPTAEQLKAHRNQLSEKGQKILDDWEADHTALRAQAIEEEAIGLQRFWWNHALHFTNLRRLELLVPEEFDNQYSTLRLGMLLRDPSWVIHPSTTEEGPLGTKFTRRVCTRTTDHPLTFSERDWKITETAYYGKSDERNMHFANEAKSGTYGKPASSTGAGSSFFTSNAGKGPRNDKGHGDDSSDSEDDHRRLPGINDSDTETEEEESEKDDDNDHKEDKKDSDDDDDGDSGDRPTNNAPIHRSSRNAEQNADGDMDDEQHHEEGELPGHEEEEQHNNPPPSDRLHGERVYEDVVPPLGSTAENILDMMRDYRWRMDQNLNPDYQFDDAAVETRQHIDELIRSLVAGAIVARSAERGTLRFYRINRDQADEQEEGETSQDETDPDDERDELARSPPPWSTTEQVLQRLRYRRDRLDQQLDQQPDDSPDPDLVEDRQKLDGFIRGLEAGTMIIEYNADGTLNYNTLIYDDQEGDQEEGAGEEGAGEEEARRDPSPPHAPPRVAPPPNIADLPPRTLTGPPTIEELRDVIHLGGERGFTEQQLWTYFCGEGPEGEGQWVLWGQEHLDRLLSITEVIEIDLGRHHRQERFRLNDEVERAMSELVEARRRVEQLPTRTEAEPGGDVMDIYRPRNLPTAPRPGEEDDFMPFEPSSGEGNEDDNDDNMPSGSEGENSKSDDDGQPDRQGEQTEGIGLEQPPSGTGVFPDADDEEAEVPRSFELQGSRQSSARARGSDQEEGDTIHVRPLIPPPPVGAAPPPPPPPPSTAPAPLPPAPPANTGKKTTKRRKKAPATKRKPKRKAADDGAPGPAKIPRTAPSRPRRTMLEREMNNLDVQQAPAGAGLKRRTRHGTCYSPGSQPPRPKRKRK